MAISRVDFGGRTLIDLTNDSVTSATLMAGETAHNAAGQLIVGTASGGSNVTVNNTIRGTSVPIDSYIMDNQSTPITGITISNTDLIEGVSALAEGQVYIYIES